MFARIPYAVPKSDAAVRLLFPNVHFQEYKVHDVIEAVKGHIKIMWPQSLMAWDIQ
jgi:hypothetical protein